MWAICAWLRILWCVDPVWICARCDLREIAAILGRRSSDLASARPRKRLKRLLNVENHRLFDFRLWGVDVGGAFAVRFNEVHEMLEVLHQHRRQEIPPEGIHGPEVVLVLVRRLPADCSGH